MSTIPAINVTVDKLNLDSIVMHAYHDSEFGSEVTLGQAVAQLVAEKIASAKPDEYNQLVSRATAIRDEELRARLVPLVEEGLERSFQRTTFYGESSGPQVTMREIIMDELKKALTQPVGNTVDFRSAVKETLVQKLVREAVQKEFAAVVQQAVTTAKKEAADQIAAMVSAALVKAMK